MCKIVGVFICLCLVFWSVEVTARGGRGGGRGGGHGGRGGRGSHGGHGGHGRSSVHSTYVGHAGGSRKSFGSSFRSIFSSSKSHRTYYNYNPPRQVTYKCYHCATPSSFPVYHSQPPVYIYRYRTSDSRYSDLFTGLALYNLGRSSQHTSYESHHYVPRRKEKCCMQIITNLKFEETPMPCYLLSSFVNTSTASVRNESRVSAIDITSDDINNVSRWLNASGELLEVTPQMRCVLWRNASLLRERQEVGCSLLQKYADTLKPPGVPISVWLPLTLVAAVILLCCCQCCKGNRTKEVEPLNGSSYTLYTK